MSVNKVILLGNVGKDPDVRHLESGVSMASFSLATSERNRDKGEITEWHNIVAWRQQADFAANYIRKGAQIYVEGRIRTRSWDDPSGAKRYVTEIQADTIQLLGRREGAAPVAASPAAPAAAPVHAPAPAAPAQFAQAPAATTPIITPEQLGEDGSDDLPF